MITFAFTPSKTLVKHDLENTFLNDKHRNIKQIWYPDVGILICLFIVIIEQCVDPIDSYDHCYLQRSIYSVGFQSNCVCIREFVRV